MSAAAPCVADWIDPPGQEKAPARAWNAAPGMKQERAQITRSATDRKQGTTLGRSLFVDPLCGALSLGDIRQQLEIKLSACLICGGTNGCPIMPDRVKNPHLRSLIAAGMILQNWSNQDLVQCTGILEGAAVITLLATLENPTWGQADYQLFRTLEQLERLQAQALTGGRTL